MKIEINLKGNKAVVKESNNIVDALEEFDAKEIESILKVKSQLLLNQ